MANVNDFMKKYYEIMDGINEDLNDGKEKVSTAEAELNKVKNDEGKKTLYDKFAVINAYNKKRDETPTSELITKFLDTFFPENISCNKYKSPFVDGEFIKALGDIAAMSDTGALRIGYALAVLQKEANGILPFDPDRYRKYVGMLDQAIDDIILYGTNHGLKFSDEDAERMNKYYTKKVTHSEAAMEAEDEKSKEVEKETSKDKKEEDKKKKEEKKKKNEENRKNTKKYFNYDSIDEVAPDLKDNKSVWYRIANRIATLLIQEEVQKVIGNEKFKLLIYKEADDFAIINETNTRVFWFKEKSNVDHFTDTNMFNIKWAEAHQPQDLKFTA